jgi:catechol 2,3-dioxygenase
MQTDVNAQNPEIGHVHLRVADLERATGFYRDVLGFRPVFNGACMGLPATVLEAGCDHRHVALDTLHSADGTLPPAEHAGVSHFAIVYLDEVSLARTVARVLKSGHEIASARDHGATLSVYLQDPDGNGIELHYNRPKEEWFDLEGRPTITSTSEPFDLQEWLAKIWSGPDRPGRKLRARKQAAQDSLGGKKQFV